MAAASASRVPVAVVGAGIVGLAAGIRILQEFPDADVTIFTESVTPNTTGDVAAGFWTPVYLSKTPAEKVAKWSADTFQYLQAVLKDSPQPDQTGVFYCPGYDVYRTQEPPEISWSHVPVGFRRISESELRMFPSEVKSGYFYVTLMAEGTKFMPVMMNKFFSLGGRLVANRKISSFDELTRQGFRRIVNCSGIGARQLCEDERVHPIRGQVMRVRAPWMNFWLTDDKGTYCLPNSDTVVIGGVSQSGNWSLEASATDRQDIQARVHRLWPPLKSATVVAEAVGLRPGRDEVRLERERRRDGSVIYHNYGHGGAGLTLFWGCAGDVCRLLREDSGVEVGAKL